MLHSGKRMHSAPAWLASIFVVVLTVPAKTGDVPALATDPKIADALRQISAQQIQTNIERLVSFGTRLTLSAQDAPAISSGRGIGAAREWIKSEFERYSKDCGGCLEVKTIVSPSSRWTGFQSLLKSPMFMRY